VGTDVHHPVTMRGGSMTTEPSNEEIDRVLIRI
jgi:hypothetical protein